MYLMIFERDSYTCVLCQREAQDVHHVKSRAAGGRNTLDNLVSLCRIHHDLVHGVRWQGVEHTVAEGKQAVLEYIEDLYAGML